MEVLGGVHTQSAVCDGLCSQKDFPHFHYFFSGRLMKPGLPRWWTNAPWPDKPYTGHATAPSVCGTTGVTPSSTTSISVPIQNQNPSAFLSH